MRNLVLFIWKHYFFFLFLLLEVFCIYLIVQNSYYQKASFINSSNALSANILQTSTNVEQYFYLGDVNEKLAKENAELRSHILNSFDVTYNKEYTVHDTTYHQKYIYTSAKVVNISTNRRNNFLTLNKGSNQGIQNNMAVIASNGVVGQVKDVSENFCTVMSLLHSKTTINSKIKKDGSYGPLTWDGTDFQYATLNDIPTHVKIAKGDTIVTSAYSRTFPENILIGTVESYERPPGKYFYKVKVKLSTDFKKLTYVYIVKNIHKDEQEELETRSEQDAKE
ncbi:MAG TPA: rod shape-determining protein MreC [Bacteroidia bacterium]|nr:rod shape-determining protein MreC [Bacteroidia bacterium]